jgi:hypothetical protein
MAKLLQLDFTKSPGYQQLFSSSKISLLSSAKLTYLLQLVDKKPNGKNEIYKSV